MKKPSRQIPTAWSKSKAFTTSRFVVAVAVLIPHSTESGSDKCTLSPEWAQIKELAQAQSPRVTAYRTFAQVPSLGQVRESSVCISSPRQYGTGGECSPCVASSHIQDMLIGTSEIKKNEYRKKNGCFLPFLFLPSAVFGVSVLGFGLVCAVFGSFRSVRCVPFRSVRPYINIYTFPVQFVTS